MSRLQCRGLIARAAVFVALLSSRPAGAQVVYDKDPLRPPGGLWNALVSGTEYDVVNQVKAERRLQSVQERLSRDAARGDSDAVNRDVWRVDNLRFRIAVDEWLIRKNMLLDPGCYPWPIRLDPMSCVAIANAARPQEFSGPPQIIMAREPMTTTPKILITIVNAEPTGADVTFAVNGVAHQADGGGSRLDLAVPVGSNITYDAGASIGLRRYSVSPGVHEFRRTAEGWALYKLPQ